MNCHVTDFILVIHTGYVPCVGCDWGWDGCKIKKTQLRRKSGIEVMDGVLIQLSVGGKRKPNTLHTCTTSAWNSMSDSCCRIAGVVVWLTAQSGLADTEGYGRREQLCLINTQWQRHITCSPRILTLLVMVTTSRSNISEVCKTMKIYRLPSCDNVHCGTRLHDSRETMLYQLS